MTHAEGGHVRAAHQASRRSFAGVSCSLCALLDDFILTVFSFVSTMFSFEKGGTKQPRNHNNINEKDIS